MTLFWQPRGKILLVRTLLNKQWQHKLLVISSSSAYGQTSTSWRLLIGSGCGHAGSAECIRHRPTSTAWQCCLTVFYAGFYDGFVRLLLQNVVTSSLSNHVLAKKTAFLIWFSLVFEDVPTKNTILSWCMKSQDKRFILSNLIWCCTEMLSFSLSTQYVWKCTSQKSWCSKLSQNCFYT